MLLNRHAPLRQFSKPRTPEIPEAQSDEALLKIVPVSVCRSKSSVDTFALLEEGSPITFLDEDITLPHWSTRSNIRDVETL